MPDTQKRVLVVEDEKPLAHALELKLQHEGFSVTLASNGQECIDLLHTQWFDVLLLDLIMPVLDGFQVLERLKTMSPKPAIFVLSNLSQHEDEQRVLQLGARKFFIKSDTPLTAIVEEIKKT
ncbi:MAG TPA: response regulator [Candidatus Saccharimonadales bacterium]|nr:response regulator [Candidatus Saccharimonadales bacterium]